MPHHQANRLPTKRPVNAFCCKPSTLQFQDWQSLAHWSNAVVTAQCLAKIQVCVASLHALANKPSNRLMQANSSPHPIGSSPTFVFADSYCATPNGKRHRSWIWAIHCGFPMWADPIARCHPTESWYWLRDLNSPPLQNCPRHRYYNGHRFAKIRCGPVASCPSYRLHLWLWHPLHCHSRVIHRWPCPWHRLGFLYWLWCKYQYRRCKATQHRPVKWLWSNHSVP